MPELDEELRTQLDAASRSVPVTGDPRPGLIHAVRQRRRRRVAAIAVAASIVIVAIGLRLDVQEEADVVTTTPDPTLEVAAELTLDAQPLPPSPLNTRRQASAVWAGTQLIVWGGTGAGAVYGDGAVYDPRTETWVPIAPSPLAARAGHVAVWSGSEMLVWGGTSRVNGIGDLVDGAAYDPATDRWRPLADAPEARVHAEAVVAGGLVVLGAGSSPQGGTFDGLLVYDVEADSWSRQATDGPVVDLAASGDTVIAATITPDRERATVVAFGPGRGRITYLPPLPPTALDTFAVVVAGDTVAVVAGTTERTAVLVLDGEEWRQVARPSVDDLRVGAGVMFQSSADAWIHEGWVVVSGPAGVHAVSLADGATVESGFEHDACGAEAAVAAAPGVVYVFGGQNCDGARGGGTTGKGRRITLGTTP